MRPDRVKALGRERCASRHGDVLPVAGQIRPCRSRAVMGRIVPNVELAVPMRDKPVRYVAARGEPSGAGRERWGYGKRRRKRGHRRFLSCYFH